MPCGTPTLESAFWLFKSVMIIRTPQMVVLIWSGSPFQKIYETTKFIRDDLDVVIGEHSESSKSNEEVLDKMAVLDQNFKGLHQFCQDSLSKLMEPVSVLESKHPRGGAAGKRPGNRAFLELIGSVEADVKRNARTIQDGVDNQTRLEPEVNKLKRKFKSLEDEQLDEDVNKLESRVDGLESGSLEPQIGSSGGAALAAITDELDRMTERLDRAESRGPDESFEMKDFSYNSYIDFRKYLLTEKVPSCGMYWDLYSCLVFMKPKGLTGKQSADEQHSS
jgi:hypothetical protein